MSTEMNTAFFKRSQGGELYNYYEIHGGPGKTKNGYLVGISFLNNFPIIFIEHNDLASPTGTWCQYEAGIPISKQEYLKEFEKATNHPETRFY